MWPVEKLVGPQLARTALKGEIVRSAASRLASVAFAVTAQVELSRLQREVFLPDLVGDDLVGDDLVSESVPLVCILAMRGLCRGKFEASGSIEFRSRRSRSQWVLLCGELEEQGKRGLRR